MFNVITESNTFIAAGQNLNLAVPASYNLPLSFRLHTLLAH